MFYSGCAPWEDEYIWLWCFWAHMSLKKDPCIVLWGWRRLVFWSLCFCHSALYYSTQLRDLWVKNNVCYKVRSSALPVFDTSLQIYLFLGRMSNIDIAALYRTFKLLDKSKLPESDQSKHPATQAQPPPQGPSPAQFRPSSHWQTLRNPEFTTFVRSTEEVKIQLDDISAAINDLHVM
jgi:hypothetical protein